MTTNNTAVTRRQTPWVAVEKSGRVVFCRIEAVSEKSIRLVGGEKLSRRRLWLTDMPPPENTFLDAAARLQQQLDANDIWRRTAGEALSLDELGNIAQAAAAEKKLKADPAACRLAAMRLVLENPVYFRRNGNGALTPLPAEILQKALASQRQAEQKKERENEILQRLTANETPPEIITAAQDLMHAPDKNAPTYRALKRHLNGDGAEFARFFINRGVLTDVRAYWRQMFYHAWDAPTVPAVATEDTNAATALNKATAAAFSIDDENTVEVDDAFSVEDEDGGWRVGIHIAAPALTLSAAADAVARRQLVSVYFPDEKHMMLPPACVKACSLALNADRAAVSLYLHCSADGDKWRVGETVLQRVRLNAQLTPTQMDAGEAPPAVMAAFDKLKRLCRHLDDGDQRRGGDAADFKITTLPPGISRRPRGDAAMVVEALMRTVNSVWAARLAAAGDGGLYRHDGTTKTTPPRREAPYMWLSSPLRRYVDLANQRVLLSLLAAVAPPREDWRELATAFEKRHGQAKHFQRLVERHWALRVLAGETTPVTGVHDGNGRVTLHDYPLTGKLPNNAVPAGEVRARVGAIDFLKQSVSLVAA